MPIGTYKGEVHNATNKIPTHYIDQQAYEQHQQLGLVYPIKSHDQELSRFFTELEGEYTTKISSMIRVKGYNDKNKEAEYLIWFQSYTGINKDGSTIKISDIPKGQTQELTGIEYYQNQVVPRNYTTRVKYTVPFSKEKVEELIEKSEFAESIQFIVKGSKLWGGYSKDEFMNSSWFELEQRGRLGCSGLYPSNVQVKAAPTQQYQVIQGQGTNKK
jgi:hypothetical protein